MQLRTEQKRERRKLVRETAPKAVWTVRDVVSAIVRPITRVLVTLAYGISYAVSWLWYQLMGVPKPVTEETA